MCINVNVMELYLKYEVVCVFRDIIANARIKFKEIYKQCLAILKEHDTKMKAQVNY